MKKSNDDHIQEIKNQAFNLLSYRDRSAYEMKDRLLKKGYQEDEVITVIKRLKELSYIDDNKFAETWVKYRIKNKPRGSNMLRKELNSKGIDENIINRVLVKLVDFDTEVDLGSTLARKWLKNHDEDVIKLKRYLYYKGFSATIIYSILNGLKIKDN